MENKFDPNKPDPNKPDPNKPDPNKSDPNDELRPEYDETLLKNDTRGKYAEQYAAGTNMVHLDPDVADAFPYEEVVYDILRAIFND